MAAKEPIYHDCVACGGKVLDATTCECMHPAKIYQRVAFLARDVRVLQQQLVELTFYVKALSVGPPVAEEAPVKAEEVKVRASSKSKK